MSYSTTISTTISSYHNKSSLSSKRDGRRLIEGRSSTIYFPAPHALPASNYSTDSPNQSSIGSTYRSTRASLTFSSKSHSSRLQPHKTSFVQNTGSAISGPFPQTPNSVPLSPSLARARKRCYAERMTTTKRIGYKLTAMKQMILRRL